MTIASPTPRSDFGTHTLYSGTGITYINVDNDSDVQNMIDWTKNILDDIIIENTKPVIINTVLANDLGENILGTAGPNNDLTNSISLAKAYLNDTYKVQINDTLYPYAWCVFTRGLALFRYKN